MKVLVVDDSALFRGILSHVLGEVPEIDDIKTARNGVEALQRVKALHFDVVLFDVEMPEMDGITAIKEMRKFNMDSRIIVISTLTQKGAYVSIEALTSGADDFISKPVGSDRSENVAELKRVLIPKVLQFGASPVTQKAPPAEAPVPPPFPSMEPKPI